MGRFTTITRSGTVAADVSSIVALVSSTTGYTAINPYRTADPKLTIAPFGPEAGVGAGFAFAGKDGKGTQRVVAVRPDGVDFDIDMGAMGTSRQRITLEPDPAGGTRVAWSTELATATTVSMSNGEAVVHDGPFAETKEQLGGFFVIEAPSLDVALDWAKKCPAVQHGKVEVRASAMGG